MNRGVAGAIGAVIVLGGGYAAATFWSGKVAEQRYAEQLSKVQGGLVMLRPVERSYQRGFFTSRSTATFPIGCPAADGKQALRITVNDTIRNGPIAGGTLAAAVVDSQVTLGGSEGERINALFSGALLTVHTVVGFDGRFSSTMQSAAATMPVGDGAVITWRGLSGSVEGQSGSAGFTYAMKSPGLTIADPVRGMTATLAGLDVRAESGALKGSMLGLGKGQGSIDAMTMAVSLPAPAGAVGPSTTVSFTGLKFTTDTQLNNELLASTLNFSGAGVVNGAKIDRFEMQTSMKRLHAPTYQRLVEKLAGAGADCGAAKEAVGAKMLETVQADVVALLQRNPEVSLDKLTVEHAGQRGEIAYSVGVQGVGAADAQLPLTALLMKSARLTASMRVPVAWIKRAAAEGGSRLQGGAPPAEMVDVMIQQAAAKGFVVREGDFLASRVDYAGGAVTVNGKPLPMGGPVRQ